MRFPIAKPVKWALGFLVLMTIILILAIYVLASYDVGPEQPIPFSHRIHVSTKQINCFFCHQYTTVSSNAGIPPVEKCYLCHSIVASQFPPINKILYYYNRGEGIPWVRVNRVPDFVHFNHQIHLARNIDCSKCHGNVRQMDRIRQVNVFNMGFCTNCHDQYQVSVDCYTCHW